MSSFLQIPRVLHDDAKNVGRAMTAALKAFAAGKRWLDVLGAESLVGVASAPGFVVLNGPSPALAGEQHFQVFLPLLALFEAIRKGKLPEAKSAEAVNASLSSAWGLLGVLSNSNLVAVIPADRHRPIVDSALQHWDEVSSIGPRYSAGAREGKNFWELPNNLPYVLGQLGVPPERLNKKLSGAELKALLSSTA